MAPATASLAGPLSQAPHWASRSRRRRCCCESARYCSQRSRSTSTERRSPRPSSGSETRSGSPTGRGVPLRALAAAIFTPTEQRDLGHQPPTRPSVFTAHQQPQDGTNATRAIPSKRSRNPSHVRPRPRARETRPARASLRRPAPARIVVNLLEHALHAAWWRGPVMAARRRRRSAARSGAFAPSLHRRSSRATRCSSLSPGRRRRHRSERSPHLGRSGSADAAPTTARAACRARWSSRPENPPCGSRPPDRPP